MATAKPKIRSYVSDFTITLGPITASGKLVPVKASGAEEYRDFVSLCPEDHTDPVTVEGGQRYICQDTIDLQRDQWHVHTQGELDKGKVVDDKIVHMSKEEIEEANVSQLEKNVLRLTVHPREEVWNSTWVAGGAYVFVPKVVNEYYAVLVRVVQDSGKAFVGLCNLRNHEGLFRLDVWRDLIVVQKLLDPQACNPTDALSTDCEQEDVEALLAMLDKKVKPFDPANYKSAVRERLEALTASLTPATEAGPMKQATPEKKQKLADVLASADW